MGFSSQPERQPRQSGAAACRPLLLGHRGARDYAPENTFAAFDLALEHGCNGIEFDVRLTADGQAIVCHDPSYHGLEIARSTCAELRQARPELPTLDEVLSRYRSRAYLYIEPKVTGLERIVAAAVRQFPPDHGYVIASFLPEVVLRMHQVDASIPLGFIASRSDSMALWHDLPITHVMPKYTLAAPDAVAEWHEAGKQIFVWTVNHEAEMRDLAHRGVDGMLSDDTSLLARTLARPHLKALSTEA